MMEIESIYDLLEQYQKLDPLGKIAMSSAVTYAAGIMRGGLEMEKASRIVMEQRMAEVEARAAMRTAAASSQLAAIGVPLEVIQLARRRGRKAT